MIIAIYQFEPYALVLPAAAVYRDLIEFGSSIKAVSLPSTDYGPVDSDVGGAETRSTTIPSFETLRVLPPEAWSPAQSERAAGFLHGSASEDTPPSDSLSEYNEPQLAHPHPLQSSGNPGPPPLSYPSFTPLDSQSPSVGTSVGVEVGSQTGPPTGCQKIGQTEGAALQEFRLACFLEDPNENVMMRIMRGRGQDSTTVRARAASILTVFNGQFHRP